MNTEEKLDKVINILYDESFLHWKEVSTLDFLSEFAKKKHDIDWTDVEINFIMTMLINDGYVVMNKGDLDNFKMPTYSLTTKGVQMKRKGGFKKTKFIEDFKNNVILWGSIIALIVSIMTIADLSVKFWWTKDIPTCKCVEKQPNQESYNNNHAPTLTKSSPKREVIPSNAISDSIKKHNVGTTKK